MTILNSAMRRPLNVGDLVREPGGRHVGRVTKLSGSGAVYFAVTVVWLDTGWLSEFRPADLEIAPEP
jgi:hypothetical protein